MGSALKHDIEAVQGELQAYCNVKLSLVYIKPLFLIIKDQISLLILNKLLDMLVVENCQKNRCTYTFTIIKKSRFYEYAN